MQADRRFDEGRVQVYTGAAARDAPAWLGLTARMLGAEMRAAVYLVGAVARARGAAVALLADAYGGDLIHPARVELTPADAIARARAHLDAGAPELVVLAGVLDDALAETDAAALLDLVRAHLDAVPRPRLELVIEGAAAPTDLVDAADLVTELRPAPAGRASG